MKITLTTKPLAEKCDALVVGATREKDKVKLSPAAAKIDKATAKTIPKNSDDISNCGA